MEQAMALPPPPTYTRDNTDDIDMDLDMFNSIMQEQPPDPGKLSHAHTAQEVGPSLASPSTLESPEQASHTRQFFEDSNQGSEQANPSTQQDLLVYLASLHSESLQSDTSSELSDFSFSMHDEFPSLHSPSPEHRFQGNSWLGLADELKNDFVDESGATNTLEDSKSNASCTTTVSLAQHRGHPSDKQLVDLTTDTDSDCEDEFTQSHQAFVGKRTFPNWLEPFERPSKALCLRRSPAEEYILSKAHEIQYLPDYKFLSTLPKFTSSSNGPAKLEPFEQPFCRGGTGMPQCDFKSNFDASSAKLYSTTGFQDGALSRGASSSYSSLTSTTKDHNKDLVIARAVEGLNSSIKEEASLDEGVMTVPLLRHQRIALAWMEKRERAAECTGGILADDQGLGKTVSTIALILKAKPSTPNSFSEGAVQISCEEASTVDLEDDDCHPINSGLLGWNCKSENEIPGKGISGSKGRPSAGTLVVCPTSVLRQWAHEVKEKVAPEFALSVHLYHGSSRTKDPFELAKHDIVLTTYAIVSLEVPKQPLPDEKEADGRNPALYSLTGLMGTEEKISSRKKTGKGKKTDGDNEKAGPLAKVAWFRVVLDEAQSIKNRRTQAARACWGLRAKRRWCLSGTPIQNTIDDLYSYFRFLRYDPYCAYKSFRAEIKDPITRDPGNGYRKLQLILHKILLRRTKKTTIGGEPIIKLPEKEVALEQVDFSKEERAFYTTLETQSREQFQMYAAAGTVQSNYVNILWMLLRLRQACDHPRLVKGGNSDAVGRSSMEHARKLSDDKRQILLSVLERNNDACSICSDAPEDAVVTMCCHVFCRQCISDKLTHDDSANCPYAKCEALLSSSSVYSWSALNNLAINGGKGPMEPSFDMLAQHSLQESSSKIKAVIKTLRALPPSVGISTSAERFESSDSAGGRTEKAIVFSQWTSMLDLLEISLKNEGFCYRRLDGTMSIQARDRALSDFKQLPDVTVIIMSLKAASLGLNMVAASHVLLIDVWWNPTTEDQAIDRAHRIGQTRTVHVSRFTVKNTIEDRILALQERKREMVASAFGEDPATDQKTRLSMDEMRYLFRV
eukprot:c24079_g1_i1 orf=750-3974(-)